MARIIDDEQQALRLAHAILSDIALYNEEAIATAPSVRDAIAEQIAEGRALYLSRVAQTLEGVFDRSLEAWLEKMRPDAAASPPSAPDARTTAPTAPATPTTPAFDRRSAEAMFAELGRQPDGGSQLAPAAPQRTTLAFALGIVVTLAAVVAGYLIAR
ncbi:MAG: hypothetical protein WCJ30_05155 [Deltaproteobacteria bacterium]